MSASKKSQVLSQQIFICLGQSISGPFKPLEVGLWARTHGHRPDAYVWCEGFETWAQVKTFPELFVSQLHPEITPESPKQPKVNSETSWPTLMTRLAQFIVLAGLVTTAVMAAAQLNTDDYADLYGRILNEKKIEMKPIAPNTQVTPPAITQQPAVVQQTVEPKTFENSLERAAKAKLFQRKINSVASNGQFWKENVPLGIRLPELKNVLTDCEIRKTTGNAGFLPLTSYEPPIKDLFPLKENTYKTLSADHFALKCADNETFDVFFNKTSKTLFAYAKTITLNASSSSTAIGQVEVEMKKYCNGPIQSHRGTGRTKDSNQNSVDIRYCQYADMVIVASAHSAKVQNDQAQIDLAYVSGRGWKEYLKSVGTKRMKH